MKQNHAYIPTTFIYPTGGLAFSCVTYEEGTRVLYDVAKGDPGAPWRVQVLNKRFARDFLFESDCLYDTLERFTRFIKTTACTSLECETGIWNSTKDLAESLNALGGFRC